MKSLDPSMYITESTSLEQVSSIRPDAIVIPKRHSLSLKDKLQDRCQDKPVASQRLRFPERQASGQTLGQAQRLCPNHLEAELAVQRQSDRAMAKPSPDNDADAQQRCLHPTTPMPDDADARRPRPAAMPMACDVDAHGPMLAPKR